MTTSVGSGIGSSLGVGIETSWGTYFAPTRWTEFESETVEWVPHRIFGKGLYNGGQMQKDATRATTTATVKGDIKTGFYYKGMGPYLGVLMGDSTTAPVQVGGTAAYLQTHNLADAYNDSLTVQKGAPDLAGTIHQYSYNGCKITDAVFECGIDEFLMCTFTIDGHDYDTSNSYVAPVYQGANGIFSFNQATFKIGSFGAEAAIEGIRKFTLTLKRPMKVDNFYLDGTGRKQQQIQNGFFDVQLDLESDYISDAAFVAQFNADTAQSVIINFTSSAIAGGGNHFFAEFDVPNMRWETEQPKIPGPEILQPKLKLSGSYDGSHVGCTIKAQSTDVSLG